MTDLSQTLDLAQPPAGLDPALEALWWLGHGGWKMGPDWARAHEICQEDEGEPGHDLAHAVAHLVEKDISNADYWFRRAGFPRQSADPRAEWDRAVAHLTGARAAGR